VVRVLVLLGALNASIAFATCLAPLNQIEAENCLSGDPQFTWDIGGNGDLTIQGFATDSSYNLGSTVQFKIKTDAAAYTIDIYRLGFYNGSGARKVASVSPSVSLPQAQPSCITDATAGLAGSGLADCGNWAVSASWPIPSNATSGIYFALLTRSDTGGHSHIVFVVRNDGSHSDFVYQASDVTWAAYNYYGLGNVYGPNTGQFDANSRAFKVSLNRPMISRGNPTNNSVFGSEYPMIRWLEANGYDVTYISGVDGDRSGVLIQQHKIFLSVGHAEYWSESERQSVEAARDHGVHLAFFAGNEVFWKVRWENSIDGSGTPYRTLVCYKETLANAVIDPTDPPTWTGTWRDPRFSPPADGNRPENALTGTMFKVNGPEIPPLSIQVPSEDGKLRFWRNTTLASQSAGQVTSLPAGTLGYEWDVDDDNGFRPAGLIHLSTATYNISGLFLLDYGSTYGNGTATHNLTLYRASSGALVFGAGTVQWTWGLDSTHDAPFYLGFPADTRMQQATVNLFADMGAQPATLQSGLIAASQSTDSTPPVSTVTSPAGGATVAMGTSVAVSGTASDTGGNVGGVEVSVDGGATWHPAIGRANWSYIWVPANAGTANIKSRAIDDSGNIETPGAGVTVTVGQRSCPCNVLGNATPTTVDGQDANPVELGVKFRSDTNGFITGIRFYKSAANTGVHVGRLWTRDGLLLASATFSGETASGWQQVTFSNAVAITAGTTYVASYFAPHAHYSLDDLYFLLGGVDSPPLHYLQDGVDGGNGVFTYGSAGGFPTSAYRSRNYWVDVVFTNSFGVGPSVTSLSPGSGATGVALTTTISAAFNKALNPATVTSSSFQLFDPTNAPVPGTVTYNSSNQTATFSTLYGLDYNTN
jgi:hypothetical protein